MRVLPPEANGARRMNELANQLRNLARALSANAKALGEAAEAACERGRLLKDMSRTTKAAAAKRHKQADVADRRQDRDEPAPPRVL
jgi:hypothetical protein